MSLLRLRTTPGPGPSLAASIAAHGLVGGLLIGVPLAWARDQQQRPPAAEVAILPARPLPPELPQPVEPSSTIEADPVEPLPEILPVAPLEEPVDPSEVEPQTDLDELPLHELTEQVPTQAFRPPQVVQAEEPPPADQPTRAEESVEPPEPTPAPEPVPTLVQPQQLPGSCPAPAYPTRASRRGWEGIVVCELLVGTSGEVQSIEILESSGYETLDEEVRRTLALWRFEPGTRDGEPSEMRVRRRFQFQINAR